MTYETILELVGYFASVLILISLLMSSAVKLRIINTVGSIVFTVYGILIHSYPTAFLNSISAVVDIYYLIKLLRCNIDLTSCTLRHDESVLQEFFRYYRNDIGHYFPHFDFTIDPQDLVIMVYADACPAGLFVARPEDHNSLRIRLDYSIPKYRDCSIGKFLYPELTRAGIRQLVIDSYTADHELYMKKMGFSSRDGIYVKPLH